MRNVLIGRAVLVGGLVIIATAVGYLAVTAGLAVRYSADHNDTVPLWDRWLPVIVGILLVRLVPWNPRPAPPSTIAPSRGEAGTLLACAVGFAIALPAAGGGEPAHMTLKLLVLLLVPVATFWWLRRRESGWRLPAIASNPWRRFGPAIPVGAWLVLSVVGPTAIPASDFAAEVDTATLIVTIAIVFAINAVLEEVFYRRWLQSRWEPILGPWPAIVLASLLWAVWHIGIQGTGAPLHDLAGIIANQGVQGLFLGYLWSRYRMMWPLLVVHGGVNSIGIFLGML